jgi:hypothetical protein
MEAKEITLASRGHSNLYVFTVHPDVVIYSTVSRTCEVLHWQRMTREEARSEYRDLIASECYRVANIV